MKTFVFKPESKLYYHLEVIYFLSLSFSARYQSVKIFIYRPFTLLHNIMM